MSLSDLASLGSFVSALAVLATLAFLFAQMRQYQSALLRAENNATQNQFSAFRLAIATNRDVAELWVTAQRDGGSLDQVDGERLGFLLEELFWASYHLWDRVQRGLLLPDEWERGVAALNL